MTANHNHTPAKLLAMSENLVRIPEYSNNETKGAWQSHESPLTQITTVFNWNRISFFQAGVTSWTGDS